MNNNIFNEISYSKIKAQVENYLSTEYNKTNTTFSKTSPFGILLYVIEYLFQLSFLYLKRSINQFNIIDKDSTNERYIKNAAIFGGHLPHRNISATGTLKLTLKMDYDLSSLGGQKVTFNDKLTLKNNTNGLYYSLNLGTDNQSFKINSSTSILLNIINGRWLNSSFTGDGTDNQTFNINLRNSQDIENFNYEVYVNGIMWITKMHLYDLLPNENSCVVRTGFNGGIDLIFGNGGHGNQPPIASNILVKYIVSDGSFGSIFRRTNNDWTFIESCVDGFGNSVDCTSVFDIQFYTDINFGADKENVNFTKNILPIVSNNFVLALPQQYAYFISRLGVFSHVNAYELNNVVYVVVTPNISLFKNRNQNYFDINVNAFQLDDYEKSKILTYLQSYGTISISNKVQISSPNLCYYAMNVFLIIYNDANLDTIKNQIYSITSDYLLSFTKMNRIPKSDFISLISEIYGVYSVDISFISKNNENYQSNAILLSSKNPSQNVYDTTKTIGLDPFLGDILFNSDEIPVIRGGWKDRNGIYYSDDITSNGLKCINVISNGTISR